MRLALFSQNLLSQHIDKLKTLFSKPLEEVRFLYINTPGNYKPFKSKWMVASERRWEKIFPLFQEFDLERAYRVDENFDFKDFFSNYDFIFVSGGNSYILSYWMMKTGAREILRAMLQEDEIVYGGESAGAVYAYEDLSNFSLVDDPQKAHERIDEALRVIEVAPIPHWENPEFQMYLIKIRESFADKSITAYPMTDDQALFINQDQIELI